MYRTLVGPPTPLIDMADIEQWLLKCRIGLLPGDLFIDSQRGNSGNALIMYGGAHCVGNVSKMATLHLLRPHGFQEYPLTK